MREELEDMLEEGICKSCKSRVVFAISLPMDNTGLEVKKCLNCGQTYEKNNRWQVKKQ